MRRIIITIAILSVLSSMAVSAQTYTPTSTWPYLYAEFSPGVISFSDGGSNKSLVNVHLRRSRLHFLDKDIIRDADLEGIASVMIGEDVFVPADGRLVKVIASSDPCLIGELVLGDFAALQETGGAYGSSSTSSATRKLSSIEFEGEVGQNQMLLRQGINDGRELLLMRSLWIVTPSFCCKATKSEFGKSLPANLKEEWKQWLKSHKIKWNNPESLLGIAEFLENK